jgi:hypothetical protein
MSTLPSSLKFLGDQFLGCFFFNGNIYNGIGFIFAANQYSEPDLINELAEGRAKPPLGQI